MEGNIGDKDILMVAKGHGHVAKNKEGMGRRTRANTKKIFFGASSEIKQIKDVSKKMDELDEKATIMIKKMG